MASAELASDARFAVGVESFAAFPRSLPSLDRTPAEGYQAAVPSPTLAAPAGPAPFDRLPGLPASAVETPRALRETFCWEEKPEAAVNSTASESIFVAARFRPRSKPEAEVSATKGCVSYHDDGKSCTLTRATAHGVEDTSFTYDCVFQPHTSQEDVYETVAAPIVQGVIQGFNGAILAYGQTGSGKTHSMVGSDWNTAETAGSSEAGVIPRALQELLDFAAPTAGKVQVRASYVEIYQERVIDLLEPLCRNSKAEPGSKGGRGEAVREDDSNLVLPGVNDVPVRTVAEAMEILRQGNLVRHQAQTKMNRHSSRSHAVFVVTVTNSIDCSRSSYGQLYLVDLAGSERLVKTGAENMRLEEAKQINKSLLALGQVIYALAHKKKHVPYRDSKLTQLLRNCLGGNARTSILVAASSDDSNADETVGALRFGARASLVVNSARANIAKDPWQLEAMLHQARQDLNELRGHCRTLLARAAALEVAGVHLPGCRLDGGLSEPSTCSQVAGSDFEQEASVASPRSSSADAPPADAAQRHLLPELIAKRLVLMGVLPSLICPLSRAVMRDPVCASDGWTYERQSIVEHIAQYGRALPLSPVTGQRLPSRAVVPCHAIAQLVRYHLPNLGPVEGPVSMIKLLPLWLVQDILSFLDFQSVARCEMAWSSFLAAADSSLVWQRLLCTDFPELGGEEPLSEAAAGQRTCDGTAAGAARRAYAEAWRMLHAAKVVQALPAKRGLTLMKPTNFARP